MAGWGDFFGGLMDKLPIQGRVERWKNELENLSKEKQQLLKGEANDKTIKRMDFVNRRSAELVQLLKNKAQ
jgi:hypothetical protein